MRIQTVTYLFATIFFSFPDLQAQQVPEAVKGVIDLTGYDFNSQGPVELRGEFEFYWNQMLNPAEEKISGEMIYMNVPGSWLTQKDEYPQLTRYGFATYKLKILLPAGMNDIALHVEDVYSASGYFLNGKAIDYLGFPGVNKFQTVTRYSRPVMTGTVKSQEVERAIQALFLCYLFPDGAQGGPDFGIACVHKPESQWTYGNQD